MPHGSERGEPFLAGDGCARIGECSGSTNVLTGSGVDLKHAACAVPSAILKAVEVEAGLNVPKDAVIRFVKE